MAEEETDDPIPEEEEEEVEEEEAAAPPEKNEAAEEEEEGDEEEEKEAPTEDPDDPSKLEIPVRSPVVASHIIARKNKQIEKLRKEAAHEEEAETEEESEDGSLSGEAQRAIKSGIEKAISPLMQKLSTDADEKELNTLVATNPDAKRYEKRIRAFMGHDGYRQVPAEMIYHHLAFAEAQKIGASKKSNADREAGHSRSGGNTPTTRKAQNKSAEAIAAMSEKEFDSFQSKVMTGH